MANEASADTTPAVVPRRSSRRESTSRASSPAPSTPPTAPTATAHANAGDATTASAEAQETPEPSGSSTTRRSRRQVKSTYATHTLASTTPAEEAAAAVPRLRSPRKATMQPNEKKSAVTPEAVVLVTVPMGEHERISKRRRPNPMPSSAASANASTSAAVSIAKTAAQLDQLVKPEPSVQSPVPTQQAAVAVATTITDTEASEQAAPASPPHSSVTPAAAAPTSANRRRRPASRQTATAGGNAGSLAGSLASSLNAVTPMGDADVSARTQEHKVLGKYTGRECTLLCEAILQQIKRNSQDPKVLERDHSPAHIRWDKIAQKVLKAHRLTISPRDAQELWKFLAYAELPPARTSQSNASSTSGRVGKEPAGTTSAATTTTSLEDQLLPASDTEEYCQSVQTINDKYMKRANRAAVATTVATTAVVTETPVKEEVPQAGGSVEPVATEAQPLVGETVSTNEQAQSAVTLPASRFRLYPAYGQPTGIPNSWLKDKPFNVKETLPFTFVADKFLKKKPGAAVPPTAITTYSGPKDTITTATTAAATTPGQTPASVVATDSTAPNQDKPKKKRVRKTENAKPKAVIVADGSTQSEPPKPKKPRVTAQKSPAGSKATATPPKSPYVPSSTPPPQPLPPRAEFQFFCRMHEEEIAASAAQLAIGESSGAGTIATAAAPATAPPVKKKTYFELQELFTSASLGVRNACQKLALEDLDRYNRECVRRRIWEKAMSNSPVASPKLGATASVTVSTSMTATVSSMPQHQPNSKPPASIPSLTVPVAITAAPAPTSGVTNSAAPAAAAPFTQ